MTSRGSALIAGAFVLFAVVLSALAMLGPAAAVMALGLALLISGAAVLGPYRFGFLALGGAFATAPMYRGIGSLGPATPTDVLLVLFLVMLFPYVMVSRLKVPSLFHIPIVLMGLLGLLCSALNNPSPISSMIYLIQWLLVLGVLPVYFVALSPSRTIINRLLACYVAGQTASVLKAFADGPVTAHRYQGFSHHPNDFGLAGAAAVVILVYLFPQFKDVRSRALIIALGAINLYSVVMSGSRAVTLALAVLVVFVPLVERSGVWAFVMTLIGALGLALLPIVLGIGGAGGSLSRLTGDDGTAAASDTVRSTALSDGVHQFLSTPFLGTGVDPTIGDYHNLFLEVAVALGLFGAVAYAVVCFVLARPLFTTHPLRRLAYLPWLLIIVGSTFPGMVDRTILIPMAPAILAALPWKQPDDSLQPADLMVAR